MQLYFTLCLCFILAEISYSQVPNFRYHWESGVSFTCGDDWVTRGPSCYRAFDVHASWMSSAKICKNHGAHLAQVHGILDNIFITELTNASLGSTATYWIGLKLAGNDHRDSRSQGGRDVRRGDHSPRSNQSNAANLTYTWHTAAADDDSVPVSVGFWGPGEPGPGRGECVRLQNQRGVSALWSHQHCLAQLPFICQKEAVMPDMFQCQDGTQINEKLVCDGHKDCLDISDELNCNRSCKLIETRGGGFVETSHPYTAYTDCWILIETDLSSIVSLQFDEIETEESLDVIKIWGGGRTPRESHLLVEFSGNISSNHTLQKKYVSPNNMMLINFKSDRSVQAFGFTAHWTNVKKEICGGDLIATENPQVLASPSFPQPYQRQIECLWFITAQANDVISIQVKKLQISGDSLEIQDGAELSSPIIATYSGKVGATSGTHSMQYVISSGSAVVVRFSTTPDGRGQGFELTYSSGCSVELTEDHGVIQSPGYDGRPYPNHLTCTWRLWLSAPAPLSLVFIDKFALQNNSDFLYVYDGNNESSLALHPASGFTGGQRPKVTIRSRTGQMLVKLVTSASCADVGFRAIYSKDCPQLNITEGTLVRGTSVTTYYNAEVKAYCASGYYLDDQKNAEDLTIKCLIGGKWSRPHFPKCVPNYCGVPPALAEGFVYNVTGFSYPAQASYQCQPGFVLSGPPAVIHCRENGTWEDLSGIRCEDIQCTVPAVNHATLHLQAPLRPGDLITVTCQPNFRLIGSANISCVQGITFSQPVPKCEDINECENGKHTCSHLCKNTIGAYKCSCFHGYETDDVFPNLCKDVDECEADNGGCSHNCTNIQGSYYCSCPSSSHVLYTANGTQQFYIPSAETGTKKGDTYHLNHTCVRLTCPSTDLDIINGERFPRNQSLFHYGDKVTYKCNAGFRFSGSREIVCAENGEWSDSPPTCRDTCGLPDVVVGAVYQGLTNNTSTGASFIFSCGRGFLRSGASSTRDAVVRCTEYNIWDFGDLDCKGASCANPGDPIGGYQWPRTNKTSFLLGEGVTFRCNDPEDELGGQSIAMECAIIDGKAQYDSSLPLCLPKNPVTFVNCTSGFLDFDVYQYTSPEEQGFRLPVAVDRSGDVPYITTAPSDFVAHKVLADDLNVTFTAKNADEKTATCTARFKVIKKGIGCSVNLLRTPINGIKNCSIERPFNATRCLIDCQDNYVFPDGRGPTEYYCPPGGSWSPAPSSVQPGCQGDGFTACQNVTCSNGGTCSVVFFRAVCSCPTGYTGEYCENNIDDCSSKPCIQNGTCTDGLANYSCSCPPGTKGKRCEIIEDNCNHTLCGKYGQCINKINDYMCRCQHGNMAKSCSNPCDGIQCQNSGTCLTMSEENYRCDCSPGYTGRHCQINTDMCESSLCQQNLACTDGLDSFTCNCSQPPGVVGRCRMIPKPCDLITCQNGMCLNNLTSYQSVCLCDQGYQYNSTLADCEKVDICTSVNCSGNGRCVADPVFSYRCECASGYEGSLCQHNTNDCTENSCINGGTCQDGVGRVTCRCAQGFDGLRCERNIDDCGSCDRLGTERCDDLVADYLCHCRIGYQGKNCSDVIDACVGPACVAGATCSTLSPGRATCAYNEDFCSVVTPCVNGGNCTQQNRAVTCQCPDGYDGKSCHIKEPRCSPEICNNNGRCTQLETGNFSCSCHQGFDGERCEIKTTECTSSSCKSPAVCSPATRGHCCKCLVGFIGVNCDKEVDNDFDLHVTSSAARLKCPLMFNGTGVSLAVMVRYSLSQKSGTFLTLLSHSPEELLRKDRRMPIFQLDHSGLMIHMNNSTQLVKYGFPINNGKWWNIALTWNKNMGTIQLYVNSVLIPASVPVSSQGMKFATLILGEDSRGRETDRMDMDSFRGQLSQVYAWNRMLTYLDDIVPMIKNSTYVNTEDLTQHWSSSDYITDYTMRLIVPSRTGVIDSVDKERSALWVEECPDDQYVYSDTRQVSVTWKQPVFSDPSVRVQANYRSGSVFTWGQYDIIYVAAMENASALCHFKLVISYWRCSSELNHTEGVDDSCSDVRNNGSVCSLTCGHEKRGLPMFAPQLLTCATDHAFNALYPYVKPLVYCGHTEDPSVDAYINFTYPIIVQNNAVNQTVQNRLREIVQHWGRLYPGLCRSNCSNIAISLMCPSVKQCHVTIIIMQIRKQSVNSLGVASCQQSLDEFILAQITEEDTLDLTKGNKIITDAKPEESSLSVKINVYCPKGWELQTNRCVQCPPGTFFDNRTRRCALCPQDQYQGEFGQDICEMCPPDTVTETSGAHDKDHCKVKCGVGQSYNKATDQCELCGFGFYQDREGQFYCQGCPAGTATSHPGAGNSSLCFTDCPAGMELLPSGVCQACPRGTYRTVSMTRCQPCPNDYTTASVNATKQADCSVASCRPGFYLNKTENVCYKCAIGSYQPDKWQTRCIACNASYTTPRPGAGSRLACKFVCPSGFEEKPKNSRLCVGCARGTYKDNAEGVIEGCKPCPGMMTTATDNSTSVKDCSVKSCPPGEFWDTLSTQCQPCPAGSYQPLPAQVSCQQCRQNYTTKGKGSKTSTDCLFICAPGFEAGAGQTCVGCKKGEYKSGPVGVCQPCPVNTTTVTVNATHSSNCSQVACYPGSFLDESRNVCILCSIGTYQPQPLKTSCIPCAHSNFSTKKKGSISQADCQFYCPSGFEVKDNKGQQSCQECGVGFYKDNSQDRYAVCTPCNNSLITAGKKATSFSDCNRASCSPGTYTNDFTNSCVPCPVSTYQPQKWQKSCLLCPANATTIGTGSFSLQQCVLSCPAGCQTVNGTVCVPCEAGFYKVSAGRARCLPCPEGTTTPTEGAVSDSQCSVVVCQPGSEYSSFAKSCVPCRVGFYSDTVTTQVRGSTCTRCPRPYVTSGKGATSRLQCKELARCDSIVHLHSCDRNNTCQDTDKGRKCICSVGFINQQFKCVHLCDLGYCANAGKCVRTYTEKGVICECTARYGGPRCKEPAASVTGWHAYVIGFSIGGVILFIIIMLIIILLMINARKHKRNKKKPIFLISEPTPHHFFQRAPRINTTPSNSMRSRPRGDMAAQKYVYFEDTGMPSWMNQESAQTLVHCGGSVFSPPRPAAFNRNFHVDTDNISSSIAIN